MSGLLPWSDHFAPSPSAKPPRGVAVPLAAVGVMDGFGSGIAWRTQGAAWTPVAPPAVESPAHLPGLSLVVPAWNDVQRLGPTLTELVRGLDGSGLPYEILVIADGCSDGTAALVRSLGRANVSALEFPNRLRQGRCPHPGMDAREVRQDRLHRRGRTDPRGRSALPRRATGPVRCGHRFAMATGKETALP